MISPLASIDAVSSFERIHDVFSGRFEGLSAISLFGSAAGAGDMSDDEAMACPIAPQLITSDCRKDLPAAVAFISIGH